MNICHQGENQLTATELVVGVSTIDDAVIRLRCDHDQYAQYQEHVINYQPDDLFHGQVLDIDIQTNKDNNVIIDLVRNSTRINVTVKGLPMPSRSHPFTQMDIHFEANNGGYHFTNDIENNCEKYKYMPQAMTADLNNILYFDLYTLKMSYADLNRYDLVIYNNQTDVEFLRADLLNEYINDIAKYKDNQAAVDAEDLFEIVIEVKANMSVEVTVNGWAVQNTGSGVQ